MDSVDCTHQKGGCTTAQEEVQEGRTRRGNLKPHLPILHIVATYTGECTLLEIAGWPEAKWILS
jgi:hypothetical protein